MPSNRIVFNGHDLTAGFTATDVIRPLPGADYETLQVPSRDGVKVRKRTLLEFTVSMNLWAHGLSRVEKRAAVRKLSGMLYGEYPARLSFGDDGGLSYMATPTVAGVEEYFDAVCVSVEFSITEPAMYGAKRNVTVPSHGEVTFNVAGTYPTAPTIVAASAYRDSESGIWGVRLDDGDFLHVATGTHQPRRIVLDCAERSCLLAGAVTLPTIDSDWFSLEPGTHTARNDAGSGYCVIEWEERWL